MSKPSLPHEYPYFRDGMFWRESLQSALETEHLEEISQSEVLYFSSPEALLQARVLDWDTNFFQTRIARLEHFYFETLQSANHIWERLEEWLSHNAIEYISVRLNVAQESSINYLAVKGFKYINSKYLLRKQMEENTGPLPAPSRLSLYPLGEDHSGLQGHSLDVLLRMARDSFTHNRFVADSFFENAKTAEMYALWLSNLASNCPRDMLLGFVDNKPVGFAVASSIDVADKRFALVTLIAIAPEERKKGYGKEILALATNKLKEDGVAVMFANIVSSNISSLLTFQSNRFQLNSSLLEYRLTRAT